MQPLGTPYTLNIEIGLARTAGRRALQAYVSQYAAGLCADLALPVSPAVRLTASPDPIPDTPGFFRILVNGRKCRSRVWPRPVFPDRPSERDIGDVICLALYELREWLLPEDLAGLIAAEWPSPDSRRLTGLWTPDSFCVFLRTFLKYNFSLARARRFLETAPVGGASESDAAYLFEQAIEEAENLQPGPAVSVCPDELGTSEYVPKLGALITVLGNDLGLLSPPVRVEDGLLRPGEFQIRLNDVRLPVIRGPLHDEIFPDASLSDISKLRIETIPLFNPLSGSWLLCAKDVPEVTTTLAGWGKRADYLKDSVSLALRANAGSLLVSPAVHLLLEHLRRSASRLVESARLKFGESPPFHRRLTAILRRLLDEQVSVADLQGIIEGLLCLREGGGSEACAGVFYFSGLQDSPLKVSNEQHLAALSLPDLIFAARLGVTALGVSTSESGREILPLLPLPSLLEAALSSLTPGSVLSDAEVSRLVELVEPTASGDLAIVVSQELRARIAHLLRVEFPRLRVIGSSEAPRPALAQGYQTVGRSCYNLKRYEDAVEMLSTAIYFAPRDPISHYDLGRVYDALNRPAEARAEYQLAARVPAGDPAWKAAVADTLFKQEAWEEAISLYRDVAGNGKQWNKLGVSLYAVGAFRKAIEAFREATRLEPETAMFHANLADAMTAQGAYTTDAVLKKDYCNQAVTEYRRAIDIDPAVARFHQHLSRPLLRLGDLDRASSELSESIRLDPKDVGARRELAQCLSQQSRFSEALGELEAANEAYPAVLDVQTDLAKARAQAGEYQEAVALAEEISKSGNPPKDALQLLALLRSAKEAADKLSLAPDDLAAREALGHIHVQLGNLRSAAAEYQLAADRDPSKPEYHKWLGNTFFKLEAWERAAAEWKKILDEPGSKDAVTFNNLGTAYDNLGRSDEALRCYETAASLAPANFVPAYNVGAGNYRIKNFEQARDAYARAAELNDTFAPAHFNLGNCYYRLGQHDKAIAEWERAIQLDPGSVEALYNLGVALWQTGQDRDKAADLWRQALLVDRNLAAAEDNILALDKGGSPDLTIFDLLRGR